MSDNELERISKLVDGASPDSDSTIVETNAETNEGNVTEFLLELSELSRRLGVYVDGCGCCGSPYLTGLGAWCRDALSWDENLKTYKVDDS